MARPIFFVKNAKLEDGVSGDFEVMIEDESFKNCLFVFNDNFQQRNDLCRGAGNACIRPYKKLCRSIGISTGWSIQIGGFRKLGNEEKEAIDLAIDRIRLLHKQFKYRDIFFSADASGRLGKSLFEVGEDVLMYITTCLQNIYEYHSTKSWQMIKEEENKLARKFCPSLPSSLSNRFSNGSFLHRPISRKPISKKPPISKLVQENMLSSLRQNTLDSFIFSGTNIDDKVGEQDDDIDYILTLVE